MYMSYLSLKKENIKIWLIYYDIGINITEKKENWDSLVMRKTLIWARAMLLEQIW